MNKNARNVALTHGIDPLTRYVHIHYTMPDWDDLNVTVRCRVRKTQTSDFSNACVFPYMSETAMALFPPDQWRNAVLNGRFCEQNASGMKRTVVWNPFFNRMEQGSSEFVMELMREDEVIASGSLTVALDNKDVLTIRNWHDVIQTYAVDENPKSDAPMWKLREINDTDASKEPALHVQKKRMAVPQLTYPLDLAGCYALFVTMPPGMGSIELRLSGDDRVQRFSQNAIGKEILWRLANMDRRHLVIRQPYDTIEQFEDEYRACMECVRLVPIASYDADRSNTLIGMNAQPRNRTKMVIGYNEPYSWAFHENVQSNPQHMEPLVGFAEACVDRIDIQIGRAGCKAVYESRVADQLIYGTFGDPVRGKTPKTDNVGRMQQYTNTLDTQLRYARMLGMKPHANLGATNCYVNTPLESDFSKNHREWVHRGCLRYDIPQVRDYVLSIFEEAIAIGARAISIDWCRYPNSVQNADTVTLFFQQLRDMTGSYATKEEGPIEILTRFPATGVEGFDMMDYRAWINQGLVNYICPSNIQGRHMHFDITPYVEAVKGTKVMCLPCLDGLLWGMAMPGMWLERIIHCYQNGADGIYVYQADATVSSPNSRNALKLAGDEKSLYLWWKNEKDKQRSYTKNIYITSALIGYSHNDDPACYFGCERLRVWVEGMIPHTVDLLIDGQRVNRTTEPPYILSSEERTDDHVFGPGDHVLTVIAYDETGTLTKDFTVRFEQAN